ncbi:NAD(P)H-dependent flavin oxidoreductase [Falsibacillus albus]|uniref:NAD(P)H-dependent flavin oxidoreductase n=1 Tax=Falsibacillus albus TaxID=2478915 RepID=UPI001F28623C|nr:nitronate monooxygenase family protein [Falsibacillus albus]
MRFHNKLCELFHIDLPIIQAGMAGGPTTPELVASVSNSGGLGTLGGAYLTPKDLRSAIKEIKKQTNRPFSVNLFCTELKDSVEGTGQVQHALNAFRKELNIDETVAPPNTVNHFEEQFAVLIEENVPVISTAFGLLPTDKMRTARKNEMKIITMITTVKEALLAENHGVDAIVAQGSDAGGHRGTFDIHEHPNGANIGTFSLIPQVAQAINIPVIAAGGIMNGQGLAASLILGAQGVQMGTRFLTCKESGANSTYQQALLNSNEEETVITKAFSGRPARGLMNKFIRRFEASGIHPLPFPSQNTLTKDIRKEAAKQKNKEFLSLWAGQGTRLLTGDLTAKEIIDEIMEEAEEAFKTMEF